MKFIVATILFIAVLDGAKYVETRNVPIDTFVEYGDTLSIYKLVKKVARADFNYKMLNNFSASVISESKIEGVSDVFEPVEGDFTYYQFIAEGVGEFFTLPDEEEEAFQNFRDILILKTDSLATIVDGFQYTLEWGEYPFEYDLFRISDTCLMLRNKLTIEELKLKSLHDGRNFDEKGIIELCSGK